MHGHPDTRARSNEDRYPLPAPALPARNTPALMRALGAPAPAPDAVDRRMPHMPLPAQPFELAVSAKIDRRLAMAPARVCEVLHLFNRACARLHGAEMAPPPLAYPGPRRKPRVTFGAFPFKRRFLVDVSRQATAAWLSVSCCDLMRWK